MRLSMLSVIALAIINGAVEFASMIGIAEPLGIPANAGGADKLNAALKSARQIQTSSGIGETLFLAFQAMTDSFLAILQGFFAAPVVLANFGVLGAGIALLMAPAYLILARDLMYTFIGRSP